MSSHSLLAWKPKVELKFVGERAGGLASAGILRLPALSVVEGKPDVPPILATPVCFEGRWRVSCGAMYPDRDVARVGRAICLALAGGPCSQGWSGLTPAGWDVLGSVARAEGVAPLLCHALGRTGWPAGVPDAVRDDLEAACYGTAARNALLYDELLRLLEILSRSPPIPAVLLKGVALAVTLYPDPALRPLSDVDLLVPPHRVDGAVARLKAQGYREHSPAMAPGLNRLVGHHVALESGDAVPLRVEIHWTLVAGERHHHAPDVAWFWDQTEEWKVDDPLPSVFQLTPTAHLLYLAAHLMLQHGGARARLLWFYDLHLLIEREAGRIRWGELAQRAREFHWSAALLAALNGARERFGTPLPEGFPALLTTERDALAARLARRWAAPLQTRATAVWNAASSLDRSARLRLMLGVLLPSPAYVRYRYRPCPAWLWPLCYPYRWFDVLREGIATLWRMINHRFTVLHSPFFILLLFALGVALVRLGSPPRVVVAWETASEVDTAGFLLYRSGSSDGPFSLLTRAPLPAEGDPLVGASYRYEDRDVAWGQRYFYQLEEVERSGVRNRFPQVVGGRAGAGWPWALAGGGFLAVLWFAGSRKQV